MKRQLPIGENGLAFIPGDVYEVDCGGEQCEDKRGVHCPDRHHIYPKSMRKLGRIATNFIIGNPENVEKLLRCQHNFLHAEYEFPELPSIEVMRANTPPK